MKQQNHDEEYILLKTDIPHYYNLGKGDWIEVFNPFTIKPLAARLCENFIEHDKAVEQLSDMILESIVKRMRGGSENMHSYIAFSMAKNLYDWGGEDRVLLSTLGDLSKLQALIPDKIKRLRFRRVEPYAYVETGSTAQVLFRLKGMGA